jgi:hypothetical protein
VVDDPDGPFLQAALICERLLTEQDGVLSMIRVVDRIFFVTDEDGNLINPRYPLVLLVTFKAGAARGNFNVEIRREKPSGEEGPVLSTSIYFEGEGDRGANLIVNVNFEPDQQGLYWFDVLFEAQRVTRIPLRAVFQRLPQAPGAP